MINLGPMMERVRRARERFEAAARNVPAHHWRTPPNAAACSAAEIVAHVPVALVAWRGKRVETPIPLDTLLLDDREVMLSRLAEQRARTLSVLEAGRDSNLRKYRLQHPFLGSLHYCDWFRTLAAHDVRHAKQLGEVMKVHKSSYGGTKNGIFFKLAHSDCFLR